MKKLDILIGIFITLFWGGNYVAAKITIQEVPSFLSIAIRFLITGLVLSPFIKKPNINFKTLYSTAIVFGVFYVGFIYYSLYLGMNGSLVSILMLLNVPFSIITARIILKEKITYTSILGIIIAFIGAIIIINLHDYSAGILALIIILLAACFNAVFNIQSRQLKEAQALSLLCWNSLISAPHLFIISYFLEGDPIPLLQNATYLFWYSLSYTIIFTGLLGVTGWIYLLQKYPIYKVMPFNFLVPFFGIIFSTLIFKEQLSWYLFSGAILVMIGVAVAQAEFIFKRSSE